MSPQLSAYVSAPASVGVAADQLGGDGLAGGAEGDDLVDAGLVPVEAEVGPADLGAGGVHGPHGAVAVGPGVLVDLQVHAHRVLAGVEADDFAADLVLDHVVVAEP